MCQKLIYPIASVFLLCSTAAVSHSDLIAYWPFDEGDGDIAGDIVGGFDGEMVGGAWVTPGKVGDGAYEGSGGDEINCGSGPAPGTDDLTLSWWMIDNHDSYGTIMDKSVTGSGFGYNILVRPSNEDSPLRFRIGGWQSYGGWNDECRLPLDAYSDGEWVHLACTYDSATDTATIYVNGELLENGPYNPKTNIAGDGGYCDGVNNIDTPLFIRGGEETFDGVLDDVAIWDQALTADEVKTVFANGPLSLEMGDSFAITALSLSGDEVSLSFSSSGSETYTIERSTNLSSWLELIDGLESEGDLTSFVDSDLPENAGELYYRVSRDG